RSGSGIVTAYDLLNASENRSASKKSSSSTTNIPRNIVTFSRAIDTLLGGGIALGEVTEISGLPASGKTQMATQLALMTRIPQALGGVQGQALYIDCEGSFIPERAFTMAQHLAEHVQVTAKRRLLSSSQSSSSQSQTQSSTTAGSSQSVQQQQRKQLQDARQMTAEHLLSDVQVYRVHDETALLATLFSLNETVKTANANANCSSNADDDDADDANNDTTLLPVRLIVVDSIAFHFRAVVPTDPQYYFRRTKTLTTLASYLGDLAVNYNVAVVVINQMTTKVVTTVASAAGENNQSNGNSSSSNSKVSSVVVPALGESWKHATTTRLMLGLHEYFANDDYDSDNDDEDEEQQQRQGLSSSSKNRPRRRRLVQERTCTLTKSSHLAQGTATFQIVDAGIRDNNDVEEVRRRRRSSSQDSVAAERSSRKRRRSM
ncbi:MAG: hypothetical protein SGILL_007564, partial [Bacillariaceae sp.]